MTLTGMCVGGPLNGRVLVSPYDEMLVSSRLRGTYRRLGTFWLWYDETPDRSPDHPNCRCAL